MKYNYAIFILAGGKESRLKSKIIKPLYPICFEPAIFYVLDSLKYLNAKKYIIGCSDIEEPLKKDFPEISFIKQKDNGYGTSWALLSAENEIKKYEEVIILQSDDILINQKFMSKFSQKINSKENYICYSKEIEQKGDGIITFFNHFVSFSSKSKKTNIGRYIFNVNDLLQALHKTPLHDEEYRLTDTILLLKNKIKTFFTKETFINMNTISDVKKAEDIIQQRINNNFIKNGVFIEFPNLTKISPLAQIDTGSRILGVCKIIKNTKIAENCVINNSNIMDSVISSNVNILFSFVEHAIIKTDVKIGPFVNIHSNCILQENSIIGNFTEIKNTIIGKKSKVKHLSYIGDSTIGDNVNIGCGTITANYDGKNKNHTEICDNVFIGCNSTIIAPVTINENSMIAAGSTITSNVPKNTLAFGRSRQLNLEGRIKNRG